MRAERKYMCQVEDSLSAVAGRHSWSLYAAAAAAVSRVRHMSTEKYTILLHTRRGRILSAGEWNCDSKQSHDLVKLELCQ